MDIFTGEEAFDLGLKACSGVSKAGGRTGMSQRTALLLLSNNSLDEERG